jgi:arsenate reductase-like glutaredoxin family protein
MKVSTAIRCGEVTVYGTPNCGWTKKQLAHFEESKTPHTFVDCSVAGACPDFVKAYPTVLRVGYTEFK